MKKYLAALVIALAGCAQLGVAPADTWHKKQVAAYSVAATIDDSALALLQAGKLKKADAAKVHDSVAASIAAIAATSTITDPVAQQNRLAEITATLVALQAYLASQGK